MEEVKKIERLPRIKHTILYTRAGSTPGGRPTFTVTNVAVIVVYLPKWFTELLRRGKLRGLQVEPRFRQLKEELIKNDLELVSYSLYEAEANIIVKSILDGNPRDARETLKTQLRLWNVSMRQFLEPFRVLVWNLPDYRVTDTGKIVYAPFGPRKKKKSPIVRE